MSHSKIRYFYSVAISIIIFSFSVLYANENGTLPKVDTTSHAMVVAAHPTASQVGIDILKKGGNAVDAAVAVAFVIGVVEPYASGLGGGGAMLIYLKKENSFRYLDYYMQAPQNADTSFSDDEDTRTTQAICIPGTPSGLITAVKKYGRLSLKEVMEPAITIASKGVEVTGQFFEATLENLENISKNSETAKVFLQDGLPYMVGDTIPMPGLLSVLENLASQGEDYFYRGEFAQEASKKIQENGGVVTYEDFAVYRALEKEPINSNYKAYTIYSAPPPQAGVTLLEILNILENAPQNRWNRFTQSSYSIHLTCEAIKRADADRFSFMGDPRFFEVPVNGLLNQQYALTRYQDIDTAKVKYKKNSEIPAGDPFIFMENTQPVNIDKIPEDGSHTTHISVVDGDGNTVSLTQTIGLFFGSGFSVDGVVFNSSMSVFYKKPSPNNIQPFKRPASTICPTIIQKAGKLVAILGTPGGGRIFNTMAEAIIRLTDFHLSPIEAIDAPRFNVRISSSKLSLEGRFSPEIIKELEERGYDIRVSDQYENYYGGVQLIYYDESLHSYIGVSDPRRGGAVSGY
jgi:gamma-glutamyltranspeptidase/glutathione hydrolase